MKKYIPYFGLIFVLSLMLLFTSCRVETPITADISSISTTDSSVSFYVTVACEKDINAKSVLKKNNQVISEIEPLELNKTTKYTYDSLLPHQDYLIIISYTDDGNTIHLAEKKITTLKSDDFNISCNDQVVAYDGEPHTLTATSSDSTAIFTYSYYLNGQKVESAVEPGEYMVLISFAGNDAYLPTEIERTLTINKGVITLDISDISVVYGEDYSIDLGQYKDVLSVSYYQDSTLLEAKPTKPGSYKAIISLTDTIHYEDFEKEIKIEIAKASIQPTFEDINVTYGENYSIDLGQYKDILSISYYQDSTLLESKPSEPGSYKAVISLTNTTHYQAYSKEIKIEIAKLRINPTFENINITYGEDYSIDLGEYASLLDITYYQGDTPLLSKPASAGIYKATISLKNHKVYEDFLTEIQIKINKKKYSFTINDIHISYGESYVVEDNLIPILYEVTYQHSHQVIEKPTLPGIYQATLSIIDKENYDVADKTIEIQIDKINYQCNLSNIRHLEGEPLKIDVIEDVLITYYQNEQMILEPTSAGEYVIHLDIQDHAYYNDFHKAISLTIVSATEKQNITITAENQAYLENTNYTLVYQVDWDIDLQIHYYKNNELLSERPTACGEYMVELSYPDTDRFFAVTKTIQLFIYPKAMKINQVTEGYIHTYGTVLHQDSQYSYFADGASVLVVENKDFILGKSYEIAGKYDGNSVIVLHQAELTNIIEVNKNKILLTDYFKIKDTLYHQYIELTGIVIMKNDEYYLTINGTELFKINTIVESSLVGTNKGVAITLIHFENQYIITSIKECTLTDIEQFYVDIYQFKFEDIVDSVPTSYLDYGMTYLSSSNPAAFNISSLKITPSTSENLELQVTVQFTYQDYEITKTCTMLILQSIQNQELAVYSIEMHQQYGDSTLVCYGDFELLIDTGDKKDGPYVNQFLKEHISDDNHLDMLIISHCHSDHMGGLVKMSSSDSTTKALDGIDTIGTIIDYGHDRSSNTMHENWVTLRNSYIAKGTTYYDVYSAAKNINNATSHFDITEDLKLDILDTNTYAQPAQSTSSKDYNIYSIACLLTYHNFKFFFAGDLEDQGESNLIKNADITELGNITEDDVVLYKAAHHGTDVGGNNGGTNGGNQFPLLQKIKPDYFYISAAMCKGNTSFIGGQPHPYPSCLANFLYFSDEIYFNGTNGTLEFITDGMQMKRIHGFGATTNYLVNGVSIDYTIEADLKLIETQWYLTYRKNEVDSKYQSLLSKYPKA